MSTSEGTTTQNLTEGPDKLGIHSIDILDEKRAELLALFPEARTEGGKIDFDRLKLALGEAVDVGKERYGMSWPGKADCFRTIQTPSVGTLRPAQNESINFETTENLIIEGDNLEVLKLLQKSYLGKIRMIYVDPPYNTGNDFIYPDKYAESLETYLEYTGQVDAEGRKFGTNTDSDGRFHSKWLNMMYPRLYLANNLLRGDGVVFISIDDAEVTNLKTICNEIFGEENFVAQLVWEKGRKNDARRFSVGHEYILGYAKNLALIEDITLPWRESKPGIDDIVAEYKRLKDTHGAEYSSISRGLVEFYGSLAADNPAKKYARSRFVDRRGIWRDNNIGWPGGGGPRYDLLHPITQKPCKVPDDGWRFIETTMQQKIKAGYIEFRGDHTQTPFLKSYLYIDDPEFATSEDSVGDKLQVMGSVFYRHTQPASDVIKEFFGAKIFENPKDHEIIERLIRYCTDNGDTVLDFFAGSGTTAQSVLELNAKDGGNRNFILVQLPEPCEEGTVAREAGFATIAEITKERARRVIRNINNADEGKLKFLTGETPSNRGFRVYKLAESNFASWRPESIHDTPALSKQLDLHVDHVRQARTDEDILCELLLKSGFPLTTPVEKKTPEGNTVYSVAGGALVICLGRAITLDLIRAIADMKPERVVCLDEGFAGNDQLKTNAVQTFKTKAITSFKTV
jgi:adenine-specific DNA-methyltransferase